MPKEQDLIEVHREAIDNFNRIQQVLRDERMQCLQDRRFATIAGAQWEGSLLEQFENKPRLEMNKVSLAISRIYSEYRNNRISVNFNSKEGDEYDDIAETCTGLYRADELTSVAEEAYDNAFDEGITGGIGAWRLRADYEDDEDEDSDYQHICIEPIYDADSSVFFDLDAKRYDKADAKYAYIMTAKTPEAYKEEFDVDPVSLYKNIHQRIFDWFSPKVVYIAEYYKIEEKNVNLHVFEGMLGEQQRFYDEELTDEKKAELEATGFKEVRKRKVKKQKVHKYIIDGARIIEDCGFIAGKYIPIVPFYGKRWFIDNVERCAGVVRYAKDAQRVKNMQLSKLAEISSLTTYEKPIFTPEQISGHEDRWAKDNVKNYPYLLVNPIVQPDGSQVNQGAVDYVRPPNVPPTLAALIQGADADMNDILGNQQAGEQIVSNISGKAVEMIQSRLDMQSFIYISNMAKSVKRSGEIWLSMAKDIFVEPNRKMKTVGSQGEQDYTELMKPTYSDDGELVYENDISKAKLEIAADVGPSSSSRKSATVRALTGMMTLTQDPQDLKILSSAALMNMEGEGLADIRKYYRKQLVNSGVIEPTKQEAQEMMTAAQNQQPDPQSIYLQAAAQEAQAKAMKAQADTEKVKADTMATLINLDREGREHVIEMAKQLNEITNPQPQQRG